jgi:hypothetical protein
MLACHSAFQENAITGGTGSYRGAGGEFSFTFSSDGTLHMTLALLPES